MCHIVESFSVKTNERNKLVDRYPANVLKQVLNKWG